MAGTVTTIPAIRDAAEAVLKAIGGLKVYDHEPRDLDELPAATLGLPKLTRRRLREAENELARWTWELRFELRLYVRLDDPETAQDEAVQLLGQVVGAYDNDGAGNALYALGYVKDVKVEDAEPGFTPEDAPRQMVIYTCQLAVEFEVS